MNSLTEIEPVLFHCLVHHFAWAFLGFDLAMAHARFWVRNAYFFLGFEWETNFQAGNNAEKLRSTLYITLSPENFGNLLSVCLLQLGVPLFLLTYPLTGWHDAFRTTPIIIVASFVGRNCSCCKIGVFVSSLPSNLHAELREQMFSYSPL